MNKISMRHEGPFFLFKSKKKTDEGQLKQMRQVPENLFFFFFSLIGVCNIFQLYLIYIQNNRFSYILFLIMTEEFPQNVT